LLLRVDWDEELRKAGAARPAATVPMASRSGRKRSSSVLMKNKNHFKKGRVDAR